jgi:hypothetical protein
MGGGQAQVRPAPPQAIGEDIQGQIVASRNQDRLLDLLLGAKKLNFDFFVRLEALGETRTPEGCRRL